MPRATSPFEDAIAALRAVSLRAQQRHTRHFTWAGRVEWPYKCPLSRDVEFEKQFSPTLEEIGRLDESILKEMGEAAQASCDQMPPHLAEAAKKEIEAGVKLGPADEAVQQAFKAGVNDALSKKGVPALIERRESLVGGIYSRHEQTWNAIARYISLVGLNPISRIEAADEHVPGDGKSNLAPYVADLRERVIALWNGIMAAEERYSRSFQGKDGADVSPASPDEGATSIKRFTRSQALKYVKDILARGENLNEYAKMSYTDFAKVFGVSTTAVSRDWNDDVRAAIDEIYARAGARPSTSIEEHPANPSIQGQLAADRAKQAGGHSQPGD